VICSYEGFGTDAMIYLKVLTSEASELLPVYNKASLRRYKSNIANHDWSSGQSQGPFSSSPSADNVGVHTF